MRRLLSALALLSSPRSSATARRATVACGDDGDPPCVDLSRFGSSLFSAVASWEGEAGNVLLSPLSSARALSLAAAGATPSGDAERELLAALGVESNGDVPRLAGAILSSRDGGLGGGARLTDAASVWTEAVKPGYAELARSVHSAEARDLPRDYAPLNEWIEAATDGLITGMFDAEEKVDPLTRAFLVDAVHFRGMWTHRFNESLTTDGTFHALVGTDGENGAPIGEERPARFMEARRRMEATERVEELGDAAALRLDYGTPPATEDDGFVPPPPQDFCALLILPADPSPGAMAKAVEGLASVPASEILDRMSNREVILSLPRFRVDWGTSSLKPALRSMGVNAAFDGSGMFTPMSDDPDVHLDDVLHRAVMEVTEEGTTAAAATMGVIMSRSMPPPPLKLKFNRPFLMAVLHVPTGTPLFLARLNAPELMFEAAQ